MDYAEDGLYHVTCNGYCSRYEFAKEILRLSGSKADIYPVPADKDKLTVLRPSYSVLDNLMLRLLDIPTLPSWKVALEEFMKTNPSIS